MPNRRAHGKAGRTAGGVFAAYRAKTRALLISRLKRRAVALADRLVR
jgi:hypothetical protein